MSKKFSLTLLTILPLILIIALMTQASSQNQPKTLDYFNIIPEDESIITIEGEPVSVTVIYEKEKLYVRADEMLVVLQLQGHYDAERNIYVINNQDFYERKVYEAKNPSSGDKIIFLPLEDLLKFLQLRYTISELGSYPTVRIQTSSFALPTPTPLPSASNTPGAGNGGTEATPTPSPQEVYNAKCTRCHTLSKVVETPRSNAEWGNVVIRMQAKEAGWISDEEANVIIQYLSGGGR